MSDTKAKKGLGVYILAVGAIIGIVALIVYGNSYATTTKAYGFMVAAVIAACATAALGFAGKGASIANWGGVCAAALMAAGLGWSLTVMVDAIGYVVSGLYSFSTLQSYITFATIGGISWLLMLIGSFTGVLKK